MTLEQNTKRAPPSWFLTCLGRPMACGNMNVKHSTKFSDFFDTQCWQPWLSFIMQCRTTHTTMNSHATVPLFQFCIYYLQLNHYQQVCITGDWGLLLMRSCHPKYTDTEMLMLFGVFLLYLYVYGGCEQPPQSPAVCMHRIINKT